MKEAIIPKKVIDDGKKKALMIVGFALDKQAGDPVVLDVRGLTNLCDYFVICSAETTVQAAAIYEEVKARAQENGFEAHHCQRDDGDTWMIVDFFDVIVHIFHQEARSFYDLEHLWRDAKKVAIPKKKKQIIKTEPFNHEGTKNTKIT